MSTISIHLPLAGESMPNRILRESLLDSPRYLAVDEGARLLYTHLLLLADDFGCLSVELSFIARRCFGNRPSKDRLDRLMGQLIEADLVRVYQHRGLKFGFIPRFRQRLKRETLKHPPPPHELLADDIDAQEKFKKLNGHDFKGAALEPPESCPPAAGRPNEMKRSEEKGSEEKGREGEGKGARAGDSRSAVDLAAELAEKMRLRNAG